MPDTGFYFFTYRYSVGNNKSPLIGVNWIKTMREGEIAIAARCRDPVSENIVKRLIDDCKDKGFINNHELISDPFIDYWDGWDKLISFDLCPCIEIYSKDDVEHNHVTNWDYRVVTA